MYKNIVFYTMNFNCENKNDYINTSCNLIKNISETINKNKLNYEQIDCVYEFTTLLYNTKIEIVDFFHLLDEFINKINLKKKIDENTIKYNINILKISNFTNNNELNMIVEQIFSN
jgi:hypothetical protein